MTQSGPLRSRLGIATLVLAAALCAAAPAPAQEAGAPAAQAAAEAVPMDPFFVAQAVAWALRGQRDAGATNPATFAAGGRPPPDPGMRAGHMRLDRIALDPVQRVLGEAGSRVLSGVISQRSALGFRADSSFITRYHAAGARLVIEQTAAEPLYTPLPQVEFSFVAAADLRPDLLRPPYEPHSLKAYLLNHAADLDRPDRTPRAYVAVVLGMDRLAPGDRLSLRVSDTADGTGGRSDGMVRLDRQGWQAAALPLAFALQAPPRLFFKAVLTAADGHERVIGTFSNMVTRRPATN
ncbi:MAG: hypothetical protein H6907_15580 [Hyphomicrobiales bacterium]|nr:hypothetical protein [Hyphomicrobiales bacterium]